MDEVKRNLDLECQLHAYLFVYILPTFSLSFFITDRIFAELTTVCLNFDLLKKIFHKYFEYEHIQNRIDRITELSNEKSNAREFNGTWLLVNTNIKDSFNLYNKITNEINSFFKKEKLDELPDSYLKKKYNQFQFDLPLLALAKKAKIDLNRRPKFKEESTKDHPPAVTD